MVNGLNDAGIAEELSWIIPKWQFTPANFVK
jgi:hypothetical protein